jgi:hypothetical protein
MKIGYNDINCVGTGTIYGIEIFTIILLGVGLICGMILGYILFYKKKELLKEVQGEEK